MLFPRAGLEISCSISDRNSPLKEYTILILEGNTVRDTIFADLALPIFIQLELNKSYVIEFSKTGFMERLVLVDTKVPAGQERRHFTYEFEIDMPYARCDTGLYAIQPVARIIYDTTAGKFDYDAVYAKSIGNVPEIVAPAEQGGGKSPAKKSGGKKGAMRRRL
ncbi:MAG TPA: hypothetical protein VK826_17330 [Bacteroidia bacterium]|nr:hypothetical protein [Bacteroidia bacterium]